MTRTGCAGIFAGASGGRIVSCEDILDALAGLIPAGKWRHDRIDNNAAAHIQATILGPSEAVPVRGGRLRLGTWQSLMLVELDGPRERTVIVQVR